MDKRATGNHKLRLLMNVLLWAGICLFMLACRATDIFAGQHNPGEYQVKAAFLYNFINFVEWPPESFGDQSLNICIVGEDPFGAALNAMRNESVRGKRLIIRHSRISDELKGCNIVFIPASEKRHVASILKHIGGANVLTVSDMEETVRQGVIIGFFIEDNKVRFAINNDTARRAGLKISARLLHLAKIISVPQDEE